MSADVIRLETKFERPPRRLDPEPEPEDEVDAPYGRLTSAERLSAPRLIGGILKDAIKAFSEGDSEPVVPNHPVEPAQDNAPSNIRYINDYRDLQYFGPSK